MSSREKHAVILLPKGWTEFLMTELRHPRTQKGNLFAFNGDKTSLCEVVCVNDPHSAWFIGNTIGKIFFGKFITESIRTVWSFRTVQS